MESCGLPVHALCRGYSGDQHVNSVVKDGVHILEALEADSSLRIHTVNFPAAFSFVFVVMDELTHGEPQISLRVTDLTVCGKDPLP